MNANVAFAFLATDATRGGAVVAKVAPLRIRWFLQCSAVGRVRSRHKVENTQPVGDVVNLELLFLYPVAPSSVSSRKYRTYRLPSTLACHDRSAFFFQGCYLVFEFLDTPEIRLTKRMYTFVFEAFLLSLSRTLIGVM